MSLSIKSECSECNKHNCDVSVLLNLEDKVISGGDDGKFKVWSIDLKHVSEVETNHGAFLSLAGTPDVIYSITSDQTIQSWDRRTLEKKGEISSSLNVPQKLFYESETKILWVGDALGRVAKFENGKEKSKYELTEEIWDLYVTARPVLIFTARDRDVLVSEIVTGQLRSNAIVKATMEGRSPLAVLKDFICCLDREGRQVQVHDNSVASKFKIIRKISVGKMILNALCPGGEDSVYAGGYDGEVSLLNVRTGTLTGAVSVGSCVNALATAEKGVYVALTDGRVLLVGP